MGTKLSRGMRAVATAGVLTMLVGCAGGRPRGVQVVQVTVNDRCEVDPADPVVIWADPQKSTYPTMVKWVFPDDVYGKITAAPAKRQDPADIGYGHTKRKLLNLEYTAKKGQGQTVLSGKPKLPKVKKGYYPIWYYSVSIWKTVDIDGEPTGSPECGEDPGVCIRGSGGNACEAYRAAP